LAAVLVPLAIEGATEAYKAYEKWRKEQEEKAR